jgi:hypothetical protein
MEQGALNNTEILLKRSLTSYFLLHQNKIRAGYIQVIAKEKNVVGFHLSVLSSKK